MDAVKALRGDLHVTNQHLTVLLGDVNAMSQRLDALERMLGSRATRASKHDAPAVRSPPDVWQIPQRRSDGLVLAIA